MRPLPPGRRFIIRFTAKEEEIMGFFWKKGPLFVR